MSHFHPVNIPVVEYYRLNGVNFTYCWRAGCTSIAFLAKKHGAEILQEAPEECVLLMKDPVERFRSAQVILPEEAHMVYGERLIMRMPMEQYLDGTLDDVEGVRSPHTWPQMGQHEAVKTLHVFKLEGSTHLAGVELPHRNKTHIEKPTVADLPRYNELLKFYEDDIKAWNDAQPLTDRIYPSGTGK
jgi:hypothetical protein